MDNDKDSGLNTMQLVKLVIGIVIFAVLMAVRTEAAEMWVRALIAGGAAAILAWSLIQTRRK